MFESIQAWAPHTAERVLKPGGRALMKLFAGPGFQEPVASRGGWAEASLSKPRASGSGGAEMYLLAKDFLMV